MSTIRRQRFHYNVPTTAAKYLLAALILWGREAKHRREKKVEAGMECGPLAYRCFLPECLRDVLLPLQHPERLQPLPGSLGTTRVNGHNHAIRYAAFRQRIL